MFFAVNAAYAQEVPIGTNPAQIQKDLEPTLELAVPPPLSLPPRPSLSRPNDIDQISFDLARIVLADAKTVSTKEIEKIYASKLGTTVTLSEIYDVADELTALYRSKGFVLSQAVIPAQRIEDGTVRIQIVEGFVAETTVEGVEVKEGGAINTQLQSFTLDAASSPKLALADLFASE